MTKICPILDGMTEHPREYGFGLDNVRWNNILNKTNPKVPIIAIDHFDYLNEYDFLESN